MLNLNPTLLSLLVACLFILVFGGLGYVRREGLSIQFALEAVGLTILLVAITWLFGAQLSPFVLLILLYLVTMRSRLTVDVANMLVRREQYDLAFKLYHLSLAWWPDSASKLIVLVNRGAAELHSGQLDAAIQTLESVLETEKRAGLGLKYEAACHYNLAYTYELKGEDAQSVAHYNETIDVLPGSLYAQAAEAALRRRKKRGSDN